MSVQKAITVRDDAQRAWDHFAKRKLSMSGFVADLLVREYRRGLTETDDERRRRLLDEIEQRLTELRSLCV